VWEGTYLVSVQLLVRGKEVVWNRRRRVCKIEIKVLTAPVIAPMNMITNAMNELMKTYGFVLLSVPEHHPPSLNGHKSVTFTTIPGCVSGKKGGVPVYEFSRVNLKHLPQPGP